MPKGKNRRKRKGKAARAHAVEQARLSAATSFCINADATTTARFAEIDIKTIPGIEN